MVVAFVLSRIAIAYAGVRFDERPINDAYQLLHPRLLSHDLLDSVAHLHSQPPLFNLFVGVGLKAAPAVQTIMFRLTYLAAGLALALSLFGLLRRVGAGPPVAAGLSVAFIVSPSVFLYENWMNYDYLLTALLSVAALSLQRYEDGRRTRDAAVFVVLLTALVLTRSMFHLFWFLAWVVVVILSRPRPRRFPLMAMAALPVLLVAGLYVDRLVRFGTLSSSSFLGMSLAKITTFQLSAADRSDLVARRELSPLALVDPFSAVRSYRGLVPAPARTGVPALDEEVKADADPATASTFRTNFNNLLYLDLSDRYLKDAVGTLRIRPDAYLRGLLLAHQIYFRPSSDFFGLGENRERVRGLDYFYNVAVYGVVAGGQGADRIPEARVQYRQGTGRTAWGVVLLYSVALLGGAVELWRGRFKRRDGARLTLWFLWSTIVYIMLLGNALEVGENNRFRSMGEPLAVVLIAALIIGWWRELRGMRSRAGAMLPG